MIWSAIYLNPNSIVVSNNFILNLTQVFERAMLKRFSLIEVNKSLKISKTKAKEEKLKLTNELRLITAPDNVYKLWSEVISATAHGELFNPDTDKKFNAKQDWNLENYMLNREFFKHLGNLSYGELSKLAKHLLNQGGEKRRHSYPKVTVKKISSVLDDCYTTLEWVERRKRKNLVMKELHGIDPSLGLLNAKNEIISENWKKFKQERFFSSATMDVLLDRPGEAYFGQAKNKRANKHALSSLKMRMSSSSLLSSTSPCSRSRLHMDTIVHMSGLGTCTITGRLRFGTLTPANNWDLV